MKAGRLIRVDGPILGALIGIGAYAAAATAGTASASGMNHRSLRDIALTSLLEVPSSARFGGPLRWHRPTKHVGLVLDLGKPVEPVITPDDPQRVVAVLREHGVDVTER